MNELILVSMQLAFAYWVVNKICEFFNNRSCLKKFLEEEKLLTEGFRLEAERLKTALRHSNEERDELLRQKEFDDSWEKAEERKAERNRILRYGTIEELRAWRKAQ